MKAEQDDWVRDAAVNGGVPLNVSAHRAGRARLAGITDLFTTPGSWSYPR